MDTHLKRCVIAGLVTAIAIVSPARSQVTATYTGATGGEWLTPANWNLSAVPGAGSIGLINNSAAWIGLNFSSSTNNGVHNQSVGAITYNGAGGPFTFGNSSTVDSGTLTLNGAAGILLQNSAATTFTLQNAVGSGNKSYGIALNSSGAIDIAAGGTLIIATNLTETGGTRSITKTGAGVLELAAANSFTGNVGFTGTGSRLIVSADSALGSIVGVTNISAGNALCFRNNVNYASVEQVALTGTGVSSSGAIENLSGTNIFAGGITMTGDSSVGATSGTLTLSGGIVGSFNLTKVGAGTLAITNTSNTFGTGKSVAISSGALSIPNISCLGNASVSIGNAMLSYTGANASFAAPFVLASGASAAIEVKSAATLSINNASSFTGTGSSLTKLGIGTLQILQPATYTGSTTVANGTLRIGSGDNRLPTGTTLTLGDSVAGTSGIFELNDRSQTVAALSSATSGSQITNLTGASTPVLTVNQSGSTSFAGRLGGGATGNALALTKSGPGTLVLRGANTYTGATTVNAGTLIVDGTHGATGTAAGDYIVSANGTLGGSGTVTLASGKKLSIAGHISPGDYTTGDDIGALTINGTTDFAPGGKYIWQFSSTTGLPGSQWDLLQLTTATMSATTIAKFTIEIQSFGASVPESALYPMTIATSSSNSFTTDMLDRITLDTASVAGQFVKPWVLSITPGGGALVLTYTPEPGTVGVVIFVTGFICTRCRFRRR